MDGLLANGPGRARLAPDALEPAHLALVRDPGVPGPRAYRPGRRRSRAAPRRAPRHGPPRAPGGTAAGDAGPAGVGPELADAAADARHGLAPARAWLGGDDTADAAAAADAVAHCETLTRDLAERRRVQRVLHLQAAAAGDLDADVAMERLDAMRWLDSSAYHVWRVVHHLASRTPTRRRNPAAEAAPGVLQHPACCCARNLPRPRCRVPIETSGTQRVPVRFAPLRHRRA
jgi:hypothetical protein